MEKFKFFLQRILANSARRYLNRGSAKIVAVTGSAGKTSTRELIYRVLSSDKTKKVAQSPENLNNEFGLPLAILGFKKTPSKWTLLPAVKWAWLKSFFCRSSPDIFVLEMAADKPGDISHLCNIARPTVAVVTNIGTAHIEFFDRREAIAKEKLGMLSFLSPGGFVVLNGDDELIKKHIVPKEIKTVLFGKNAPGGVEIMGTRVLTNGTEFTFKIGSAKITGKISVPGVQHVYSAAAAVAVGIIFGLRPERFKEVFEKYSGLPGRGRLIVGKNEIVIIDEAYNANPESMYSALKVLDEIDGPRKIAILGEMREIGKISPKAHREIGALAAQIANITISIGGEMKAANLKHWFATTDEALPFVLETIQKGDIILVKGSHAVGLEKIVKTLS